MRENVLIDIDMTLANSAWRDHLIPDWNAFHDASSDDPPLGDMITLVNALWPTFCIIGLTGRPERYRKLTMEWFLKHEVKMDELLMRPNDDFHPAPLTKVLLVKKRFESEVIKDHVAFIIDDREDIISVFRGEGVTALHVHARAD